MTDYELAKGYLEIRGFEGNPLSWHCVQCYLSNFLRGKRDKVQSWIGRDWDEAYNIINEYFDKEPVFI